MGTTASIFNSKSGIRFLSNVFAYEPVDPKCEALLVKAVAEGTRALGSPEALVDGTSRLHGSAVDSPVEEQHDEHRQIEGTQRRVDDVSSVVRELADPGAALRYLHSHGVSL